MHIKKYFKVKVREPYMGNDVPLKIEVRVFDAIVKDNAFATEERVEVIVTNPEGMTYHADEITRELFIE